MHVCAQRAQLSRTVLHTTEEQARGRGLSVSLGFGIQVYEQFYRRADLDTLPHKSMSPSLLSMSVGTNG